MKHQPPSGMKKIGLHDGSYSVSDTQDYFECIIKKHETMTDNPPVRISVNKINMIKFRIETGYYLKVDKVELL